MKVCVLCGREFTEYGNNPWPLAEDGQCCNECDDFKVIPARLRLHGVPEEHCQKLGEQLHAIRLANKGVRLLNKEANEGFTNP